MTRYWFSRIFDMLPSWTLVVWLCEVLPEDWFDQNDGMLEYHMHDWSRVD